MGYSQAQKAESRERVVQTAARQIREDGLEALGVADCMRAAGLTHGAFYGHFDSRDALIEEALKHALNAGQTRIDEVVSAGMAREETPLKAIADSYLSERHVQNPGTGCALCAVAGDTGHADGGVKALYTDYLRKFAVRLARASAADNDRQGLGIAATIVGAINLARAVDDPALAQSILASAHDLVMSQERGAATVF